MSTTAAGPRERWAAFFTRILGDQPELVAVATGAAITALRAGADQDAAVAAGMSAARAHVDGLDVPTATPSRPTQSTRPTTPPTTRGIPRTAPHATTTPVPPAATRPAADPRLVGAPPGSAVAVVVERRTESLDGQFFQVISARLRRIDGGRLVGPLVPVEMRGRSIIGQLLKDDIVMVPDTGSDGTRIVKTLRNVTTSTTISAKGRPFRRWRTLRRAVRLLSATVAATVTLAVLAAVAVVAYLLATGQSIG